MAGFEAPAPPAGPVPWCNCCSWRPTVLNSRLLGMFIAVLPIIYIQKAVKSEIALFFLTKRVEHSPQRSDLVLSRDTAAGPTDLAVSVNDVDEAHVRVVELDEVADLERDEGLGCNEVAVLALFRQRQLDGELEQADNEPLSHVLHHVDVHYLRVGVSLEELGVVVEVVEARLGLEELAGLFLSQLGREAAHDAELASQAGRQADVRAHLGRRQVLARKVGEVERLSSRKLVLWRMKQLALSELPRLELVHSGLGQLVLELVLALLVLLLVHHVPVLLGDGSVVASVLVSSWRSFLANGRQYLHLGGLWQRGGELLGELGDEVAAGSGAEASAVRWDRWHGVLGGFSERQKIYS